MSNIAGAIKKEMAGINQNEELTLRDYFAGQALVGLLHPGWERSAMNAVVAAYCLADAMLAEREKGRTQ
jgi:hypothetical protein